MAVNRVICQVTELDEALRQYQSQGCLVQRQSRDGCAVLDCKGTSIHDLDTPATESAISRGPHDGIDEAYAGYWGKIPD